MKDFFKFMFMFIKEIVKGVFHVFRIPFIIIGVAFLAGIFSRQAMCIILFLDFGVVVMSMPVVFTGRKLLENITITRNGEKFSGMCTGYKLQHWNSGYDVHWIDGQDMQRYMRFDVPIIKFKFPCTVNVYTLNNISNLGVFTVIRNAVWFAICLLLWIGCTGITFDNICKIFVYG